MKTPVFGLLKRGSKVETEIVHDCTRDTLIKIIRGKVGIESIIHSDSWHSYDGFINMGFEKPFRVNYSNNVFALKSNLINGIESFWFYSMQSEGLVSFMFCKYMSYLHLI